MPKITLQYNQESEIPADLKPFAKADNTVEIWTGQDETAVAAELNPNLEANRNKILAEKTNIQRQYDALLETKGTTDADVAKYKAEAEKYKNQAVPAEDAEIATTAKKLFPNLSAKDLETRITEMQTAATEAIQLKQEKQRNKVVEALGYKNAEYFNDILQIPGMLDRIEGDFSVEQVAEGDKTVPKVYVQVKQQDGTLQKTAFEDYKKTNPKWQLHESVLTNSAKHSDSTTDNSTWLPQNPESDSGGGQTGTGLVGSHIANANKKAQSVPNPFVRNAPQSAPANTAQPTGAFGVNQN